MKKETVCNSQNIQQGTTDYENGIRPELLEAIKSFPPVTYTHEGIISQRAGGEILKKHPEYLPTDSAVRIYNREIAVEGNKNLRIRIYEPRDKNGVHPGVLWIHGGGMAIGLPESDDAQNIRFVKEAFCVVISVDYRLAPENPYPIPLNDCYGALVWFYEHAKELNVDRKRIAVAGVSGGGGLALSLALRAKDKNYPHIAYLMPISPMISRSQDTPSLRKKYDPRTLNYEGISMLWSYYLGNVQETDAYMEPIKGDFSGLPPVYTSVGELDPFRDDTVKLAILLMNQDIPVELHIYPGCFHVFDSIAPNAEISKYSVSEFIRALNENLNVNI